MKKVLSAMLSCVMTISCLSMQTVSLYGEGLLTTTAYSEPNWREMYANQLKKIYDTSKDTDPYFDDLNYWALYDLNNDGIPELLHERAGELFEYSYFDVYTIFESKLCRAGAMSGYLYYDASENVFWTAACADGSDNEFIDQYCIIDGEIIQNFSMYYIIEWTGTSEYVVNNKNVSKEEYEKYAAKYNLDNYTPVDTYEKPMEHYSFSQIDEILAGENIEIALSTPKVSKFYQVAYPALPTVGDGSTWVMTWDAVENADGYEYHFVEESDYDDIPYIDTRTTTNLYYYTAGSVPFKETVRVRAYKSLSNNEKVYSDWSVERTAYVEGVDNGTQENLDYSENAWRTSYKEQLDAYRLYHANSKYSLMYGLDDLDKNGIPELIISFGEEYGEKSYTMHTYDGKMELLVCQYFTDEKYKNLLSNAHVTGRSYALSDKAPIDEWDGQQSIKEFKSDVHGNSFLHGKGTGGGFEGSTNHYIPSNYVNSLSKYAPKCYIWKESNEKWEGSCHGVAMTMALNYNEKINIPNLSKISAKDYYNMEKPCNNPDFLYTIEYYQIAQSLGTIKSDARVAYFTTIDQFKTKINPAYDTIDKALETIVKCTSDSTKAYVLSYFFPTIDSKSGKIVNEGHSIIACGCKYYSNTDTYEVTLFDENFSYKTEMVITGDFKKFRFIDGNNNYLRKTNQYYTYIGNMENDDKFITIELVDVTNYCDAPPNACNTSNLKKMPGATITSYASQTSNQVRLQFPVNSSFTLSNAAGEYLTYNSEAIDLDMTVYDHSFVIDGESSNMVLVVDYSDYFLMESQDKATSFTVYNNDSLLSIENANITEAEFDLKENQIVIEGRDYDFDAYIVSDSHASREAGLLKLSASADGIVNLSAQNNKIEIAANSVLENITALSITDDSNYAYKLQNDNTIEFIVSDTGEITSAQLAAKGDVNGDGKIDTQDVAMLDDYLLCRNPHGGCIGTSDVNNDGEVNVFDLALLKRMVLGTYEPEPTSITLDKNAASLYLEESASTVQLNAIVTSADMNKSHLIWKTNDSKIATVSDTGLVTAVGTGTAIITVTTKSGNVSAACEITVKEPSIAFERSSITVYVDDTYTLLPVVSPTKAALSWSTDNASVASVENGRVTAKKAGNATITASIKYNGKVYKKSCVFYVEEPSLSIPQSKSLYIGDTASLTAVSNPSGRSISWTTSNSSVATVSSSGYIIAKGSGTATITAKMTYNNITYVANCSVKVTKPSVSLNVSSKSLYIGDTTTLTATTNPSGKSVTWSTLNPSVASVSSSGIVTAKGAGTATIRAEFTYGGVSYLASCTITVATPTVTLSSYSGSGTQNVWDIRSLTSGKMGYIVNLPTATASPSGCTISWEVVSGDAVILADNRVCIRQPKEQGVVKLVATIMYNGIKYKSAQYTYSLSLYKNCTAVNYFYYISNAPLHSTSNRYSFNIPAGAVVDITRVVVNGDANTPGSTVYGQTTYNGETGWIIITYIE